MAGPVAGPRLAILQWEPANDPHLSLILLLPPLSLLPSPWLRPPALLLRGSIGSSAAPTPDAPAAASPRLPRLPVLAASLLELARTSSGMSAAAACMRVKISTHDDEAK